MGDKNSLLGVQIERIDGGSAGEYIFNVPSGKQNEPIANINWYAAARFANWLHNGMPIVANSTDSPGTETGAYNLNKYDPNAKGAGPLFVARNADARYWIPSEDEWYKAAYFDPGLPDTSQYWLYPTASNQQPDLSRNTSSDNAANYNSFVYSQKLLNAGSFTQSASYFGTLDQAGSLWEWTDTSIANDQGDLNSNIVRGGSWSLGLLNPGKDVRRDYTPNEIDDDTGFRIASSEPATISFSQRSATSRSVIDSGASERAQTQSPTPVAYWSIPGAFNVPMVAVADTNNPADATGYGQVAYYYRMGKFEITVGEYVRFLNSVATRQSSPAYILDLWREEMADKTEKPGVLVERLVDSSGNYMYSAPSNRLNLPIGWVNWFSAARFANWVHNGGTLGASTETGAYELHGATTGIFNRTSDARYWIPTEDEWYKSAYYDPTVNAGQGGYWTYATRSDRLPTDQLGALAQSNAANYNDQRDRGDVYTPVGSYVNSASYYGTYDQSGNVWEWNDAVILSPDPSTPSSRGVRGGSFSQGLLAINKLTRRDYPSGYVNPDEPGYLFYTDDDTGFRLAGALDLTQVRKQDESWAKSFDISSGDVLRFSSELWLSAARIDAGTSSIRLGLRNIASGNIVELLADASGGSQFSIRTDRLFYPSGDLSWLRTEGQRLGSSASSVGAIAAGDWMPVAWAATGQQLMLSSIEVTGNTARLSFEGGVQALLSSGTTGAFSVPAPDRRSVVTIQRLGLQNNGLAFYEADPITGEILVGKRFIAPGDSGYLQAALGLALADGLVLTSDQLPGYQQQLIYSDLPLDSTKNYGLLLLRNGSTGDLVSSFSAANPDEWVGMIGMSDSSRGIVFAIEDLPAFASDRDYNDLIVTLTNPLPPLV